MDSSFWLVYLIRNAILEVPINPFLSIRVNVSDKGKTENNPHYILHKTWLTVDSGSPVIFDGRILPTDT